MDIAKEALALIGQPRSERLEYRAVLPSSREMGQIVCSFANAHGGFLIIGVAEIGNRLVINGLSDEFQSNAISKKAISLLSPKPTVYRQNVFSEGKRLYVLKVERSSFHVRIEGEAHVVVPPVSDALFSWIHISDLHVGHGDAAHGWDQVLVTHELQRDISTVLGQGVPPPHVIFVTGDIAFSGDTLPRPGKQASQEYADARLYLLALGQAAHLDARRIFVIPGNHDVQRTADQSRNVRRLLDGLRSGREFLDDALAHAEDRALLAQRQAHYLAFAAGFAPACLNADGAAAPEDRLWWRYREQVMNGPKIRMVGLNTALLATDDADHGKLALGKASLAQVLTAPPPDPDELVIVLSHHPFRGGWMMDEKETDGWVRSYAHLHLFGHVHEADSEEARRGAGGAFVSVAAGATHGEKNAPAAHGYNIAAVMRGSGSELRLRLWPRRWSAKNKAFRADTDNLPDGQNFAEHTLRLRWP